jgi:undecaprenyl-diphosphatase
MTEPAPGTRSAAASPHGTGAPLDPSGDGPGAPARPDLAGVAGSPADDPDPTRAAAGPVAGSDGTRVAAVLVALATGVGLAVLTLLVIARWAPLEDQDQAMLEAAHSWARESSAAVSVSLALDAVGAWQLSTLAAVVTVVLLGLARRWRWAVGVALVTALAPLLTDLLKPVVERPRPVWPDPLAIEATWSFPSGHATGGIAVWCVCAVALGLAGRDRWGWSDRRTALVVGPWLALGVLIGISRVVLGVHHPSDVVAGWLVALAVAASALAALAPTRRRASAPEPESGVQVRESLP